jgi:long-chain fatty acid transport protein
MLRTRRSFGWLLLAAVLAGASSARGQGIIVPSAGPINSAMAGASTAAPVDFGSSYWNPANLSGLDSQEFLLGSALALPSIHMQTAVPAGAVGGLFPPTSRFGEARSNSGVASGLATGFSFRLREDSPLTLGLGVFGVVGGGVNFNGTYQVPLLTPRQFPNYAGFGPIFANVSLIGINPMASLRLTDRLSIGGGPIITAGTPSFNPAFFAPGPKGPLGLLPTFPAATNARPYWGGGFQVGLLYELNEAWNFGFSYKSPIWQEKWDFNASYPNLAPRLIGIQASLPEILSWGVAYKGLPRTLIDVDLRYFDYANTSLFGTKVIDGGLGWRSVFAVALGAQYQATDRLMLRAGYLYNTNPIRNVATLFNVQAPGIITNTFTLGASYDITEDVTFSLAWMHGFRNAIQGPILQLPSSTVRLDAQLDTLWAGVNVKFGRSRRSRPEPISPSTTDAPIAADDGDSFVMPPPSPPSPGPDPAAPSSTGGTMPSELPPLPTDEAPGPAAPTGPGPVGFEPGRGY